MSSFRLLLPAVLLAAAASGCAGARLVQGTADGGVVAIPSNSNSWPQRYRESAEKLMAERCPNGYDIVEEKEVVVGQMAAINEYAMRGPNGSGGALDSVPVTTATVRDQKEYQITFRARSAAPSPPRSAPTAPPPPPGLPARPVPIAF